MNIVDKFVQTYLFRKYDLTPLEKQQVHLYISNPNQTFLTNKIHSQDKQYVDVARRYNSDKDKYFLLLLYAFTSEEEKKENMVKKINKITTKSNRLIENYKKQIANLQGATHTCDNSMLNSINVIVNNFFMTNGLTRSASLRDDVEKIITFNDRKMTGMEKELLDIKTIRDNISRTLEELRKNCGDREKFNENILKLKRDNNELLGKLQVRDEEIIFLSEHVNILEQEISNLKQLHTKENAVSQQTIANLEGQVEVAKFRIMHLDMSNTDKDAEIQRLKDMVRGIEDKIEIMSKNFSTKARTYEDEIASRSDKIINLEDEVRNLVRNNKELVSELVYLHNKLFRLGKDIAEKDKVYNELVSRQAAQNAHEISQLGTEIANLKKNIEDKDEAYKQLFLKTKQRILINSEEFRKNKVALQKMYDDQIIELKQKITSLEANINSNNIKIEELERLNVSQGLEINDHKKKREILNKENVNLKGHIEILIKHSDALEFDNSAMNLNNRKLILELEELRYQINKNKKEYEQTLQEVRTELSNNKQASSAHIARIVRLMANIRICNQANQELNNRIDELTNANNVIKRELEKEQKEKQRLEQELILCNEEREKAVLELASMTKKHGDSDIRVEELKSTVEAYINRGKELRNILKERDITIAELTIKYNGGIDVIKRELEKEQREKQKLEQELISCNEKRQKAVLGLESMTKKHENSDIRVTELANRVQRFVNKGRNLQKLLNERDKTIAELKKLQQNCNELNATSNFEIGTLRRRLEIAERENIEITQKFEAEINKLKQKNKDEIANVENSLENEISALISKYNGVVGERNLKIKQLEDDIRKLQLINEELNNKISDITFKYRTCRGGKENLISQLAFQIKEYAILRKKNNKLESELIDKRQQITDLQAKLETQAEFFNITRSEMSNEIETKIVHNTELQKQIYQIQEECSKLAEEKDANYSELKNQHDLIVKENISLRSTRNSNNLRITALQANDLKNRTEISILNRNISAANKKVGELTHQIEDLQNGNDAHKQQLILERDQAREQLFSLKEQYDDLLKGRDIIQDELNNLKVDNERLQRNYGDLDEKYKREINELKKRIKNEAIERERLINILDAQATERDIQIKELQNNVSTRSTEIQRLEENINQLIRDHQIEMDNLNIKLHECNDKLTECERSKSLFENNVREYLGIKENDNIQSRIKNLIAMESEITILHTFLRDNKIENIDLLKTYVEDLKTKVDKYQELKERNLELSTTYKTLREHFDHIKSLLNVGDDRECEGRIGAFLEMEKTLTKICNKFKIDMNGDIIAQIIEKLKRCEELEKMYNELVKNIIAVAKTTNVKPDGKNSEEILGEVSEKVRSLEANERKISENIQEINQELQETILKNKAFNELARQVAMELDVEGTNNEEILKRIQQKYEHVKTLLGEKELELGNERERNKEQILKLNEQITSLTTLNTELGRKMSEIELNQVNIDDLKRELEQYKERIRELEEQLRICNSELALCKQTDANVELINNKNGANSEYVRHDVVGKNSLKIFSYCFDIVTTKLWGTRMQNFSDYKEYIIQQDHDVIMLQIPLFTIKTINDYKGTDIEKNRAMRNDTNNNKKNRHNQTLEDITFDGYSKTEYKLGNLKLFIFTKDGIVKKENIIDYGTSTNGDSMCVHLGAKIIKNKIEYNLTNIYCNKKMINDNLRLPVKINNIIGGVFNNFDKVNGQKLVIPLVNQYATCCTETTGDQFKAPKQNYDNFYIPTNFEDIIKEKYVVQPLESNLGKNTGKVLQMSRHFPIQLEIKPIYTYIPASSTLSSSSSSSSSSWQYTN
jgi:chromosome segregation ATPase